MESPQWFDMFEEDDYLIEFSKLTPRHTVRYLTLAKSVTPFHYERLRKQYFIKWCKNLETTMPRTDDTMKAAIEIVNLREQAMKEKRQQMLSTKATAFEEFQKRIAAIEALKNMEVKANKEDYVKKNAVNHKEYMNERIICACGISSIRKNLSTHKKSKKHKEWESEVASQKDCQKNCENSPKFCPVIKEDEETEEEEEEEEELTEEEKAIFAKMFKRPALTKKPTRDVELMKWDTGFSLTFAERQRLKEYKPDVFEAWVSGQLDRIPNDALDDVPLDTQWLGL